MKEVNSMFFEKREDALKFIALLLEISQDSEYYNDIHAYTEETSTIVEWTQVPYDRSFGGRFEYIDSEHVVLLERALPDGTYIDTYSEQEYEDRLNEWLQENPGWVKNTYGIWYKEEK